MCVCEVWNGAGHLPLAEHFLGHSLETICILAHRSVSTVDIHRLQQGRRVRTVLLQNLCVFYHTLLHQHPFIVVNIQEVNKPHKCKTEYMKK